MESLESQDLMDSYALFQITFRFVYQDHWPLKVGLMLSIFPFFDWKNTKSGKKVCFFSAARASDGFCQFPLNFGDKLPKTIGDG